MGWPYLVCWPCHTYHPSVYHSNHQCFCLWGWVNMCCTPNLYADISKVAPESEDEFRPVWMRWKSWIIFWDFWIFLGACSKYGAPKSNGRFIVTFHHACHRWGHLQNLGTPIVHGISQLHMSLSDMLPTNDPKGLFFLQATSWFLSCNRWSVGFCRVCPKKAMQRSGLGTLRQTQFW